MLAGDLPSMGTAQPTQVTAGTNWSGFYVGLNGGATKGATGWSNPTGAWLLANSPRFPSNSEQVGLIAGGTVGWNFQSGAWVFGVEGDIDVADNTSNGVCGGVYGVGGYHWYCKTKTNLFGSVSGRAGYVVGPILGFAKLGPAFSRYKTTLGFWNPALPHATQSQSSTGLDLGLGVEYSIAARWSAKFEVDHYSFGKNKMYSADVFGARYGASVNKSENLVKFGLNYRFAGEPSEISVASESAMSDWSGEFGTRMGWTAGHLAKNLYSSTTVNQLNSKLTWSGQDGMNLEGFGKLDHTSGIVVSALIGGAQLNGSSMHDEDFVPAVNPYSNTVSRTKNGGNFYATVDIGYKVLSGDSWKLIEFIGFNYYEDRLIAYGCNQTTASTICSGGSIVGGQMTLSQSEKWSSMRVGLGGEFNVTDHISLVGQAAWLPFSRLEAVDNHWLRSDINPMKESAIGHQGYQLEAIASYKLTDRVSVGVGARHWSFSGSGHTKFPTATNQSPLTFSSNRSSIFAQLSYAFGK